MLDYDALYEQIGLEILSSKGGEDKFHCPDFQGLHKHGDRSGKFYINREKGVAHCFVCGGMTIRQLVAQSKGIGLTQADQWLKDFTNDALVEDNFLSKLNRLFGGKTEEKKAPLPYFNESILDQWQGGHIFFARRGISEEIRERFKCGYDEKDDAIVFPLFWHHQLVGWQKRHLSKLPKYQFSENFPKKETLWGFDQADGIPILVESIPTAMCLISEGYPSIATFGSAVSDQQITYLRKFSDGVILAPDNDMAGQKWLDKCIEGLNPYIPLFQIGPVEGNGADIGDLHKDVRKSYIRDTIALVLGPDYRVKV